RDSEKSMTVMWVEWSCMSSPTEKGGTAATEGVQSDYILRGNRRPIKEKRMALLIKNGDVVTADARYRADVGCEGETATTVGPNPRAPAGADVIDATGKFVFPGFIDPHVHIYLPFMGTFAKDSYETASRAALVGGTTTLIEMVCPARADDP